MDPVMDHATLAAFVDGALSPEDSARVVLHLADHPGDAAHVDALMEINALLGQAYAAPLHEPAPARILAAIRGEVPAGGLAAGAAGTGGLGAAAPRIPPAGPRAGWRRGGPSWIRRAGIAAALAASVAVVVSIGLDPGRMGQPVQILGAPPAVDADLRAALETAPSGPVGTEEPQRITLIGTFLDGSGRPCREYELADPVAAALTQGVACRTPQGEWSTEVAVASRLDPAADRDAFVPASGATGDPEALDRALDRLGAGMTMTPQEESTLIASWR